MLFGKKKFLLIEMQFLFCQTAILYLQLKVKFLLNVFIVLQQGPQGFSQPMSHQMGNRNLVGPPGLVGGRNPRGGDPFGFDDFNDFDDPYDDMMAFGPSKGRDTMGPHKPFGPPGIRGF